MKHGIKSVGVKWGYRGGRGRRGNRSDNVASRREGRRADNAKHLHRSGCAGCGDGDLEMFLDNAKECACVYEWQLFGASADELCHCAECDKPTHWERFCSLECELAEHTRHTMWLIKHRHEERKHARATSREVRRNRDRQIIRAHIKRLRELRLRA